MEAVTDSYAAAQLDGLKAAVLATGGITLVGFLATPHLPGGRTPRTRQPNAEVPTGAPEPGK
ncbi:hypothetical protein [Streptomyces sp. SudanB52_2052]|uniref:hypothetical protein n=1 Tax=Streptomyces sp. SudanB52_2052 TaxID=3035276 RepID=UPI0004A175C6|nr:hypothetical protein DF19_38125 [Streptomyces olindensis]